MRGSFLHVLSHSTARWSGSSRGGLKPVQCKATKPSAPTSLEVSTGLARVRAIHSASVRPLFKDPYATALSDQVVVLGTDNGPPYDVIATKYVDDCLLKAVGFANMELKDDYRQVVLLGCGMDSRPYRLPWPPPTVLYCVAPPEVQQVAEAVLSQQGARLPRACLLRRVNARVQEGESFCDALQRAGFRADKLSVWGLQGQLCSASDKGVSGLTGVFSDISALCAFGSVVLGVLPPLTQGDADNLLGSFGLLGASAPFGSSQADYGLWGGRAVATPDEMAPRLFCAEQRRMSLLQMCIYEDHVRAAEEADEDFFGNVS